MPVSSAISLFSTPKQKLLQILPHPIGNNQGIIYNVSFLRLVMHVNIPKEKKNRAEDRCPSQFLRGFQTDKKVPKLLLLTQSHEADNLGMT